MRPVVTLGAMLAFVLALGAYGQAEVNCFPSLVPGYSELCVQTVKKVKTIVLPSPSPTPSASPSPAPTATPSPSPSPTATPTPSPAPSPTPSPEPTSTPSANVYTYHGCQVYGNGQSDPIVNANLSALASDPSSTNILNNIGQKIGHISGGDDASLEIVNLATNQTSLYTVGRNGGHTPPITQGVYGGGTNAQVPWSSGFALEGTDKGDTCSGDCHWVTLNTDTCYAYEGGGGLWNGSAFATYDGLIDNLGASYSSQIENKSDNVQVAGIPMLGWADYGEEASVSSINHPLALIIPTGALISGTNGVNYSPGVGNGAGTCSGASNCLELGDVLQYIGTCPSTPAQAVLVCQQISTYGLVVTDTGSEPNIRMGLDTSGRDDWPAAFWAWAEGVPVNASDFRVILRGSL